MKNKKCVSAKEITKLAFAIMQQSSKQTLQEQYDSAPACIFPAHIKAETDEGKAQNKRTPREMKK